MPLKMIYPYQPSVLIPLQILLSCSRNPSSEHRALHLHVDVIERTHSILNPIFIHLLKELFDSLFRLRGGRVRSDGCAGSSCVRSSWLRGRMEEEEFDVCFLSVSAHYREEKGKKIVILPPVMKQET